VTALPLAFLGAFGGAIDFIFHSREAATGGIQVGGLDQVWELMREHIWVSFLALAVAIVIAMPVALYLGHRGTGEIFAIALGNAGRAVPELALIAFAGAFLGFGLINLTLALMVVGVPPILTNTFVAVRQVDQSTVAAARGMGMTESEVLRRIELPLAAPGIVGGVRTAALNIIATATIAPLVGVLTLGDFIISRNVYGDDGVLAGAILVAVLALTVELLLGLLQRALTPEGVRLQRAAASA
jgi:osmoprotectant transport system permease protein